MNTKAIGRMSINITNSIVNNTVLVIIVLLVAFAGYALWDSNQLHMGADKSNYSVYKPTQADNGKSFKELQDINDEVFAWLTIYGTNIDYPVTQGPDNMKYVNTNAEGQYSLSGAIFLDYANSKDFSDFNNILYGHHMARNVMFGEIGEFSDKRKFDSHLYGNLHFNDQDHGIEFFAFLHVDAYDRTVFDAGVREEHWQSYLDGLLDKAIHIRDIGITINDRIVLLSTCSSDSTNGRDILVGRISDASYENNLNNNNNEREAATNNNGISIVRKIPLWALILVMVLIARLVVIILDVSNTRKRVEIYET